MSLLVITSRNVILPGRDQPSPASIYVDLASGKISNVQPQHSSQAECPSDAKFVDYGDLFILPGLVDAHVHLNEPGRTDWEGFATGTQAASSGGVTAVIDMPLNSIPPTTTVPNLSTKREAALGQCWTDVGFWGGVIPGNQGDLVELVKAGVRGFKCFTIESGVEEFPCVNEQDLHLAMKELADQPTVLLFHAELDSGPLPEHNREGDPRDYATFLHSRPQKWEVDAIQLITDLQKHYLSLRCHVVHLSAADALTIVREAKATGLKLTAETCFHYLCLSDADVPAGHPEFKCCPPIRDGRNRDRLWEALLDGTLDFVVSDHSPCVASLKCLESGNFMKAWGGISTLGLGLSLLWTEGQKRGVSLAKIVEWTSVNTAKHAGLAGSKGAIQEGFDADFAIFDPTVSFEVTKDILKFKNKLSPYEGLTLQGRMQATYVRGQVVWSAESGHGEPIGRLI